MKYLKHLLIFIGISIAVTSLFAQGEIQGKVVDQESKIPYAFANVYVKVGSRIIGSQTDLDGRFVLKPLQPGVYNVHVTSIEFNDQVIPEVNVSNNKITFLNKIQVSAGVDLGMVTIAEYTEPLINPEDPLAIPIKAAEIAKVPGSQDILGMIGKMVPQFYKPDGVKGAYVKGSRNDASGSYVDGMKADLDGLNVPPSSIGEITVYTGGVPARYGDLTGGVVIIETKSYFSLYNQYKVRQEQLELFGN